MVKRSRNQDEIMALREQLHEDLVAGRLSIPETCRQMREITRMSQAEYARFVGVAPRTLINLERGVGNPSLETLNKIGAPFRWRVVFRPQKD